MAGPGLHGASSVALDSSGNSYVVGNFETSVTLGEDEFTASNGQDGFLAKDSPAGDVLWARQVKGTWARNLNRVRVDRGGWCMWLEVLVSKSISARPA